MVTFSDYINTKQTPSLCILHKGMDRTQTHHPQYREEWSEHQQNDNTTAQLTPEQRIAVGTLRDDNTTAQLTPVQRRVVRTSRECTMKKVLKLLSNTKLI